MKIVTRSIAVTVMLVTPALAKAQTAEMPVASDFKAGETWEWRVIDNYNGVERGRDVRTVVVVGDTVQISDSKIGKTVSVPDAFSKVTHHDSPKPWRVWPLQVGKKWSMDADWTRPGDGVTGNTQQDVEVVAYEQVSVPAGKFMAFRIEHRGYYTNERGSHNYQNDTYWYAPKVRADVKHVRDDGYNKYTRELVSYGMSTATHAASCAIPTGTFKGDFGGPGRRSRGETADVTLKIISVTPPVAEIEIPSVSNCPGSFKSVRDKGVCNGNSMRLLIDRSSASKDDCRAPVGLHLRVENGRLMGRFGGRAIKRRQDNLQF